MTGPIVLEGCDGAGKSTLAAALAARHGLSVLRNGPPTTNSPSDLALGYARQLRPLTVIDRSWPSERCYGPILRGGSLLGTADDATLMGMLHERGGSMVICLPPIEACIEAWASRPAEELLRKEALLRDAHAWYARYAAQRGLHIWDRTAGRARTEALALFLFGDSRALDSAGPFFP